MTKMSNEYNEYNKKWIQWVMNTTSNCITDLNIEWGNWVQREGTKNRVEKNTNSAMSNEYNAYNEKWVQ